MKFAHLADLHIGKRLYEYSLIDNQRDILLQIVELIKKCDVDGVVISGDIYDKSVPPVDALALKTRPIPIPFKKPPKTVCKNISFIGIIDPISWVKPRIKEYIIILVRLSIQNSFFKYIKPSMKIGIFNIKVPIPTFKPVK